MEFNKPEVRQRVLEHILFAVSSVAVALPVIGSATKEGDFTSDEEKFFTEMAQQLRNPIIMQILSFTLSLDYELRNTLQGKPIVIEKS